jgi:streptogramin lyase
MANNLFRDIPTLMELNPRHNINFFESANTNQYATTFGSLSTGGWSGGCLAPNGNIYAITGSSTFGTGFLLKIDPIKKTTTSINIIVDNVDNWKGLVLAPNGKMYSTTNVNVLEIDPVTETSKTFRITDYVITSPYNSLTLGLDGNIYGIPYYGASTPKLLKINPIARTAITTATFTFSSNSSVLAPNGKIYCIPSAPSANTIAVVDPTTSTPTVSYYTLPVTGRWASGVLGNDGNIYASPTTIPGSMLKIDPTTTPPTVSIFGSFTDQSRFYDGGTLAPNGKIYWLPNSNTSTPKILELTPGTTPTLVEFDSPSGFLFYGSVLGPDGKIYGLPYVTNKILELSTGCAHKPSLNLLGPHNNL